MDLRNVAIVSGMVAAVGVAATSVMAQVGTIPNGNGASYYGHDMMWGSGHWGGFGMIFGPIFMILIVVGIVAAIIYLLRLSGAAGFSANSHPAHDRAIALLKERYAKGEIDTLEFEERKKLLAD
jgi:putative membrane protein